MSFNNTIKDLLTEMGIEFVEKGADYLVKCTNPEHDDDHPSMRIDRITGKFNCFSCGHRGNIFMDFGEYQSPVHLQATEIREQIKELTRLTKGLELPAASIPYEGEFRNLKQSTYTSFNAFICEEEEYSNRIIFPITDTSGKILCFNGRHMHTDVSPKYKIYPEGVSLPLYPFVASQYMILVEGLFDVLNLYDKGVNNAVCTFGTQNLTYRNVQDKLLPYSVAGVQYIFLLLDNDKAGHKATEQLKTMLEKKTRFKVIDISHLLPEGVDPGAANKSNIKSINRYIEKVVAK